MLNNQMTELDKNGGAIVHARFAPGTINVKTMMFDPDLNRLSEIRIISLEQDYYENGSFKGLTLNGKQAQQLFVFLGEVLAKVVQ